MEKINEMVKSFYDLGRPLRSILAVYNNNRLSFNFGHLRSSENVIIEKDLSIKIKKVKNFKDYENF